MGFAMCLVRRSHVALQAIGFEGGRQSTNMEGHTTLNLANVMAFGCPKQSFVSSNFATRES